ncbi:hypothetical protein BGX21_008461 [Mortierella sp. AD011]|nr:hypothetical protein BGX20_005007 [Mortierella sp. AD010]KAF9402841.1 hypothetical protein BGX21_008461 [Mortierella sp. AD011]
MAEVELQMENDPPSQAVHNSVVGFVMLMFIVTRVLTTRGFAALKPGFNTRAIVTWLAYTSLTLYIVYNAVLARILYKDSIAGVYAGPQSWQQNLNDPFHFPISISLYDLNEDQSKDFSNTVVLGANQSLYYVLDMKPTALYLEADWHYYHGLRLVLKLSQACLLACLLVLNTYWCRHVEALVDEGDFMSKTEMYLYYILATVSLVVPLGLWTGLSYGLNNFDKAEQCTNLILVILGAIVIICYTLTCIRLRGLERDSRNVNGNDTSTTLQLTYYVNCVYWLIGCVILILIIGILYQTSVVTANAVKHLVLAQAMNDLQGALFGTLTVMVYPAAMFLLYPSIDVLTAPENDPGPRFQKRVRRSIKDAKRIRESLYLEGESMNGVDTGHHSSIHGLTTYPSSANRPSDNSLSQGSQQRYSFYEPMRRERMGSITAVVNEMQMIAEEDGGGSLETSSTLGMPLNQIMATSGSKGKPSADKAWSYQMDDIQTMATNDLSAKIEDPKDRQDSNNPNGHNNDIEDTEVTKKWLVQNEDLDRTGAVFGLEKAIPPNQYVQSQVSTSPLVGEAAVPTDDDLTTLVHSDSNQPASSMPDASHPTATPKVAASISKHSAVPLAGILKTRNSTQNPIDQSSNLTSAPSRSSTQTNAPIPTYNVRTSSIQGAQRKSNEYAQVKRMASNSSSPKPTLTASTSPMSNPSAEQPLLSPTSQQRRSNVTGRVDAGVLALVAQQQQQQQQQNRRSSKSRSSKDGIEVDYFGLRKSSIENSVSTTPPPLSYEPQVQGIQPLELNMSPTMTGFLMADPYPSVGTRYLDGDSDQETSQLGSPLELQDDKKGCTGSSKKYKAPPPPIPTEVTNAKGFERRASSTPATPTTPTTPPGVRPTRSVDTVVDQQFIEMANQMYDNHVMPAQLTNNTMLAAHSTITQTPPVVPEHSETQPKTSTAPGSPTQLQTQQNHSVITQQGHAESPLQRAMAPPAKSPYRVREHFESRIVQGGPSHSGPNIQAQGPATPPSPASTASPTIASTTTLPRPLTPAWYETKTNFASTNDVLTHYNAVMRSGSHLKQGKQQEQQMVQQQQPIQGNHNQAFYRESAVGPLDDVPQAGQIYSQKPDRDNSQQQAYSQQPRMGSADSFGVIRRRPSNGKNEAAQSTVNQQQLSQDEANRNDMTRYPQPAPQVDRHSFMMPSETISTYSTWTGDLSDVTNTSGEVSVGAFADRKHASSLLQPHQQQGKRRSDEKSNPHNHHSGDEQEKDRDVRKSQASAYSMGSSFGAGSSSRQSAGAYSNYSSNSGFGSGSIIISAPLSSVGQPLSNPASGSSPSGSSPSNTIQKHSNGASKRQSSLNRSGSGSVHSSHTGSAGGSASDNGGVTEGTSMTVGKMNSMRLSAFGPGEDDVDLPETGNIQLNQNEGVSSTEFFLNGANQQTPQDLERQIQQEWMDRRAAVKKDSKNRLEQLHKQQQEIDEQKKLLVEQQEQQEQQRLQQQQNRDRQQRYLQLQSGNLQGNIFADEPYSLNSVYFKSTAEILQLGKSPSADTPDNTIAKPVAAATAAYPYSRAESIGMSSSSPSDAVSASPIATTVVAEGSSPSPSPNSCSPSPASRPIASPTFSAPYGNEARNFHEYDRNTAREHTSQHTRATLDVDNVIYEGPSPLIQSSSSYALHHQSQLQSQARRSPQPPPPSLLHYDSIDSIATVRAHRYQLSSSPSSPQPQRSIPSSPTSPSSPTPMSQRQYYAQYRFQQPQQQFQHPQSDLQPQGAFLTVLGPSQYRIIPDDVASERSVGRGSASPASRAMSPVERTSSRMTNLTNPESEYQWESAELNHHRWEMMETPQRKN